MPGIVVDTHVKRITGRLGLTKERDPVKIEFDLYKKKLPKGALGQTELPAYNIWQGNMHCKITNVASALWQISASQKINAFKA